MTDQPRQELTLQDFGELPLRALVGFTARCGRRILPVLLQAQDSPAKETAIAKAEAALALAEDYARDQLAWRDPLAALEEDTIAAAAESLGPGQFVVFAAGHAASALLLARQLSQTRSISDAMELVAAAYGGYRVLLSFVHGPVQRDLFTSDMVLRVVSAEFEQLRALDLGRFGHVGQAFDASQDGPLGPLWPEGPPSWYP